MDSMEIRETILDKKLDTYRYSGMENFVAEKELTVTITLQEYRDLLKEVATKKHDIEKAEADKYSRETENKKLKEENELLRTELLKHKMDRVQERLDAEEGE